MADDKATALQPRAAEISAYIFHVAQSYWEVESADRAWSSSSCDVGGIRVIGMGSDGPVG